MEINNWKKFERLVAAINATKMNGAEVKWNDKINGRQFDVSIRFKFGNFYYLTVIECKEYKSKIPVEKVEAFITKSNAAKANKAVMVSSSGFQKGAIAVANNNGIELFTLSEKIEYPKEGLISIVIPAINLFDISLERKGKRKPIKLGVGPKLNFLVKHTFIIEGSSKKSLNFILSQWINKNYKILSYEKKMFEINFKINCSADSPEEGIINKIRSVKLNAQIVNTIPTSKPGIDPYIDQLNHTYICISNVLNGSFEKIKLSDIDHDFDTEIKEGCFYTSPSTGLNYYCEKIEGDLITMWLLESYQHGSKIDVRFSQKIENAKGYQQIFDENLIKKLRKSLEKIPKSKV